jgi:excisionase family DNA binding protein
MEQILRRDEECLTVAEVAERLKLNEETVRRLFMAEPGVIVIYRPRKGRRQYRTLRIPEHVFQRVVMRFTTSP